MSRLSYLLKVIQPSHAISFAKATVAGHGPGDDDLQPHHHPGENFDPPSVPPDLQYAQLAASDPHSRCFVYLLVRGQRFRRTLSLHATVGIMGSEPAVLEQMCRL